MESEHILTPDDWNVLGDEIAFARRDTHAPGWWIINSGRDSIHIHEDEIAALCRIAFDNDMEANNGKANL